VAFKIGNQTVLDIDIGGATKIESATDKDVVLNPGPGGEIYVSVGTSVTFEGSNPADDFEGRLKATTLTSDRYYILPDTVNSIVAVLDATAFPTGDITTYVDTAEADAISSSNLYTDGRETAITTTYQAYADQAEADAIASAASDATTKANAAQTAAISTASSDATTKANAALSSANTYTDAAITNNVDFTGYAQESYVDTAEADAIASAEAKDVVRASAAASDATTKANAALSSAQSYADAAEADAIASAASDATTKANAAKSEAISEVTNGAGAAFDTLKEIQDAMATDTELSSAISSVTSSAAATASADATTKANAAQSAAASDATTKANAALSTAQSYADQAEADAESAAASDATTKANAAQSAAISTASSDATTKANAAQSAAISTASSDATTKASAAQSAAISTASSDATTKANAAQSAAQSYADANDTNTTYTAGNGMTLSGTQFLMSGAYTGNFTATGDVTAYSDIRFKHNVETITNAIDTVNNLRGVMFEKDNRHSTGVIAQEVEAVFPAVVHTNDEGLKSVAYGNIVGLLIEAVKEQQIQITSLKEEINNLKK